MTFVNFTIGFVLSNPFMHVIVFVLIVMGACSSSRMDLNSKLYLEVIIEKH